jgi:hypothetical protein
MREALNTTYYGVEFCARPVRPRRVFGALNPISDPTKPALAILHILRDADAT